MGNRRDKAEIERERLAAARRHRRKWPVPEAALILSLHFKEECFNKHQHHASATLEVPIKDGDVYFTVSATYKTREGALRKVIETIENSNWFHVMRKAGVRFRVTGVEVEDIYRGYL